jgi:hypothetical protein
MALIMMGLGRICCDAQGRKVCSPSVILRELDHILLQYFKISSVISLVFELSEERHYKSLPLSGNIFQTSVINECRVFLILI